MRLCANPLFVYKVPTYFPKDPKKQMKKKLQSILVCPLCKGPLLYKSRKKELICEQDKLAYPVRNGIPVLLNADARKLNQNDQ